MSYDSSKPWSGPSRPSRVEKFDDIDANIRNFAPVARIMKNALPDNAKIAKEAKECMQECVSEFISFITSEGQYSSLPSILWLFLFIHGSALILYSLLLCDRH